MSETRFTGQHEWIRVENGVGTVGITRYAAGQLGDIVYVELPAAGRKLAAGGDHPRWVVKGGNFKKFGVTCWPETLEAAGVAEKLDPLKDNKPKGDWIAHYTERQNDEGKWVPDKVTRLEKQKAGNG